ncbi:MAG TPA: hypothetical protein VKZ60_16510 [Chloroflexota bacterium]|nr:hypothetical protein [Chloroflexota bacterium]
MYEAELPAAILRALAPWGRLPESDLVQRLSPVLAAHLRPTVFLELARQGLIEVQVVGDERVLTLTEQGRRALAERAPAHDL